MQRSALAVAASGLALLVWLPLALAGVPLDTPDGFLHLGWAAGWARQLQGGDLWPQWTDLNWAGAGSFALTIYPPLFRLVLGAPLALGVPPDHALAGALLAVLLVNSWGAAVLAQTWLPRGRGRWLLVLLAGLNPYLLVNIYVRGAWPEALALACLWWLAAGMAALLRELNWGLAVTTAALAAIVLSNWNSTVLTLVVWSVAAAILSVQRAWAPLHRWLLALVLALTLTAVFWWPALQMLPSLRAPIPAGLLPGEFFMAGASGAGSFGRLLWIQSLTLALLLTLRWLGWGSRSDLIGRWGLSIALIGLLLTLSLSEPLYQLVPPLQRIQFPWRWLGPAWFAASLWICSAQEQPALPSWRRLALLTAGLGAAGCWFDGLWRFRSNLTGHAPSQEERQALRQLLACDPLQACPRGHSALPPQGELTKRFAALDDGRIALAGVPDYSPHSIPASSWNQRLAIFWLPQWPQTHWARFSGEGSARLISRGPRERTLQVEAHSPGQLRIMQWAHPQWRVQIRPAKGPNRDWSLPIPRGSANQAGWVELSLPNGTWEVALTYGKPR